MTDSAARFGSFESLLAALWNRINNSSSFILDIISYWRKVVAVNRGSPRGDRTRRALSVVVLLDRDAIFRRYFGPCHLQKVELGGDLEQSPSVLGELMHMSDIAGHHTYFEPPG
jgi:hypothetical protein